MSVKRFLSILERFSNANDKLDWVDDRIAWKVFLFNRVRQVRQDKKFDQKFGTDTAGEILLEDAGVPIEQTLRGNGLYRPFRTEDFHTALSLITKVSLADFTFVDMGSGKGKLLLLATEYPFRKFVGVEYAPLLHEIAKRNIDTFKRKLGEPREFELHLEDAVCFNIPVGPIVLLIFNSFNTETTRVVMRNLDQVSHGDRPVIVIYANMRRVEEIGDIASGLNRLRLVTRKRHVMIFSNAAASKLMAST